ncbi:uncharacterized protein N7515_000170 [Penicillium bovifimosum]|uniref:Uncharacterized protein n=1 Tax=Penicillium bovifimosum TaxID=126998 RepID=A0A9W9HF07_9EURO|nr:uncharacterized protein N7515_000170 [Penicillium bovifimosum]KAJ5145606.1 hypothetical protein N7515_000170 [Penicillium bovifimosum]
MKSRASTAERSTEAANESNPNGFVTKRKIDGERRSIRHYSDGRVSERSASVEPAPRTRASTRASTRNSSRSCSRNDTCNTTRASSHMGPFISRRSSFADRPPSAFQSKLSDLAAEISAEVARFSADKPGSASAERLRTTWSNVRSGKATPKNTIHSSGASVASSNCSTRTGGSVLDRIADIEDRVRRQNVWLKPVLEGDE